MNSDAALTSFGSLPVFGAIDTFWIIAAIAIASWIYDAMRKKAAEKESGPVPGDQPAPPTTPPRTMPPPVQPTSSWEAELRRLLGEAPPVDRPAAPAPPPPPVIPKSAGPARPVATRPAPVIVRQPKRTPPQPPPAQLEIAAETGEMRGAALASFEQSRVSHERASHLHENVAEHLRSTTAHTQHPRPSIPALIRKSRGTDLNAAIQLIRNPRTVRQAMVASFIVGLPKSLEAE